MKREDKNNKAVIFMNTCKDSGKRWLPACGIPKSVGVIHRLLVIQVICCILLFTGIVLCTSNKANAGTVDIAVETFASKSWSSGSGWPEKWYHEGDSWIVTRGRPNSDSYHMRLRGRMAWTDRPLDLSGYRNARLGINVKVRSFEKRDWAGLMVKSGTDNWKILRRFTSADSNNRYQYYEFDLTPYGLNSDFWIGFEAEMNGKNDYLYIDDIRIFTNVHTTTGPKAEPIFGVTIDDISNAGEIKDSLSSFGRRPYARIVFDEYVNSSYYKETVADFNTVAGIMGEILDSFYVEEYSLKKYAQRTRDYVRAMAEEVDIWEIGNEINGEWLGQGAMDKAAAAYDIVKAAGEPTALTLYYNGTYDNGEQTSNNCWERSEHQMQVWAQKNVPERMKNGLDWVLVSFYEEDCEFISPNWHRVFEDLHEIFPNSKIGFGEIGTSDSSKKEATIQKYYGMKQIRPEFIGGYFWWYYNQDMVPKNSGIWTALNECVSSWDELYR